MKLINIILVAVSLFASSVFAAGWEIDSTNGNKLTSIINSGDQGGVLKLSCDTSTKKLALQYMFEGKVYDFFVIRKFGDINGSVAEGKISIGLGTTTQAQVFKELMFNKGAIAVIRFPVGTKAIWDKAIEDVAPVPPALEQEGEEFFLTGNDITTLMNKIGSSCPFNPADKDPIF
ncbi:hypothetical protein YUBABA_01590 [Serratia phage vB_SmaM-Yubaba]|nr:hypothetical protein YUBABA_01590 [Serratia phage vB_SmaM-Yubaba]